MRKLMKGMKEAGAQFKLCSPVLDLLGNNQIPEINESVSGAYVIGKSMD